MSAVKFGSCRDETCYTSVSVRLAIQTLIWCQRKFSCASTSTGRCESICAWAVKDYVGKTYTKSPSRSANTVSATTVFAKWRWLYSIFLLATQYEMFVFEAGGRPALYCNKVSFICIHFFHIESESFNITMLSSLSQLTWSCPWLRQHY